MMALATSQKSARIPLFQWESFWFHLFMATIMVAVLTLLLDSIYFHEAARVLPSRPVLVGAAILGYFCNLRQRTLSALFVWVPSLIAFVCNVIDLTRPWSFSVGQQPQWDYVKNQLFGPGCDQTECLYTVPAHAICSTVVYSLMAFFCFLLRPWLRSSQ